MIIVCLNVYEEVTFLPRCIEHIRNSLRDICHKIVVVDGAYKDFPHKTFWSDDGTLEIARKSADALIEAPKRAWDDEIEKRNAYWVGEDGDYYLVIDADEMLTGTFPPQPYPADANMMLVRNDNVPPYKVYRWHKHRRGIHYSGTHHAVWVDHVLMTQSNFDNIYPVIKDVHLYHVIAERTRERLDRKHRYYALLREKEKEARARYHL
jgi:hypothetical protein